MDVRGRSSTLRINTAPRRRFANRRTFSWDPKSRISIGDVEDRRGTVSILNGPAPGIQVLKTVDEEIAVVSGWLGGQGRSGVLPHEIGVFVRSAAELDRARAAVASAKLVYKVLDEHVETASGHVSISTMHLAKACNSGPS